LSGQAKRRGAETEIWAVEQAWVHLRDAEHIRKAGENDRGDFYVALPGGLVVVQSKAVRKISLHQVLKEAGKQATNFGEYRNVETPRSAVLVRPNGLGRARIDEWPLVQTYGQFLEGD